jgi:hypothetical protein
MGTTLTGTTPQDTYDSLIKVTDNGPLSGTAKYLSDGLGNDSALALSTGDIGIGTTSLLSASGFRTLTMNGSSASLIELQGGGTSYARIQANSSEFAILARGNTPMVFYTNPSASDTERMRITSAGNVGIGTPSPSGNLHVSSTGDTYFVLTGGATPLSYSFLIDANDMRLFTGVGDSEKLRVTSSYLRLASGMGGIQFNGDTAAANALDDYEEGTWTPSLGGNTTYAVQVGTYTKIGRQVVAHFAVSVTTLGTGSASVVSGLPFTSNFTGNRGGGGISYALNPSTGYASINPFVDTNSTSVKFLTSTILGGWADASNVFTDGSFISGTVTYFV